MSWDWKQTQTNVTQRRKQWQPSTENTAVRRDPNNGKKTNLSHRDFGANCLQQTDLSDTKEESTTRQ